MANQLPLRLRALRPLFLAGLIFLAFAAASIRFRPVAAADPVTVDLSEAAVRFPRAVDFRLTGTSTVSVVAISLEFSTPQARYRDYTRRIKVLDNPGSQFDISWTWEPNGNPDLPPGAQVRYHWVLDTRDGPVETPNQTATFDDPRFEWKSKTAEGVRLVYYTEDDGFAEEMAQDAEDALARIATDMKLEPTGTMTLYIYEDSEALRGALPFSPIWIGGVAFPEFDTILIGIPTGSSDWARSSIAHELSHQVTYQLTFNPSFGSQVPPWLNEGLAVVSQPTTDPKLEELFRDAIDQDKIPTLRSLAAAFPDQPHLAGIDYAASESAARFLIARFGADKLHQLLANFQEGMTTTDALEKTYGFTQDEIEDQWRESLGLEAHNRPVVETATAVPTLPPTTIQTRAPRDSGGEDLLEIPEVRVAVLIFAALAGFIVVTFAISMVTRRD